MIAIRSGSAVAEIAPEVGGALTRFAWTTPDITIDWLRPASHDAVARAFPQGMSCFPLVPFSNRIRDGKFTFRGQQIVLPPNFPPEPHAIHGHGWRARWHVVEHAADHAVIEYVHAPDAWPFAYRARQTFQLSPRELLLDLSVENLSEATMPLGLGFHPYFIRTAGARITTSAGLMWQTDAQSMPVRLVEPPGLAPLDPNAVALDNNFIDWSGRALMCWPEWKAQLELRAAVPFACLVLYTPPHQDYFCVEPATNCIDAFNLAAAGRKDTGMLTLEPQSELVGQVQLVPSLDV